jgi:hypothetical protein
MRRFFFLIFILAIFTFAACKKSEENSDQKSQQAQSDEAKTPGNGQKKGNKKGGGAAGLEIFQEDKLVATVPHDQYANLATADVTVEGKNYKGILLSDLLKKYNVTGKTITLQGPAKQSSITWDQATSNPIYVYLVKNRLQLYTDSKNLEDVKLPQVVIKITAAEQPAAAPAEKPARAKGQKKTS